jgi:hypothetical protein
MACRRIRVLSVIVASIAFSGIIGQLAWGAGAARDDQAVFDAKTSEEKETDQDMAPDSEALIAAALKAGTITYEESLRQRAFALYGDPRLEPHFRSPVIDWEAGRSLFAEIVQKEAALSKELLADLAPFRARPNDPISVFNRSRPSKTGARQTGEAAWIRRVATGKPAQSGCTTTKKLAENWESELVPGTNVRAWIPKAYKSELGKYKGMVWKVWRAFPAYFTYPLPDDGNPCDETNPDSAVDVYFVIGPTIDPRKMACRTAPSLNECTLNSLEGGGVAWFTRSNMMSSNSGYAMVDIDGHTKVEVLDTIAHELAHISQFAYDHSDDSWLHESTAMWVTYKVMKELGEIPQFEYDHLTKIFSPTLLPVFQNLDGTLNHSWFRYSAWLFFYSVSIDLGDKIVKDVWEKARGPDHNGIFAVNQTVPLIEHFPRYTVRNWNRDLVPAQWRYRSETRDKTFPTDPKPREPVAVNVHLAGPGTEELTEPIMPLAAHYYTFTFADSIRKVTFQNLLVSWPDAHIWAIQEIGGQWKEPEDWTKETDKVLCRDISEENVTKLVLVMSNSRITGPLPSHPLPRVQAEATGCQEVVGWAKATLHVKDDIQDVSYASSKVNLRFKPRAQIDRMDASTEYDLLPTSVTWTAAGTTVDDCTISGQILVTIPSFLNQPLDPTRPAYGYLKVMGLEHGDFHSVEVSATGPDAFFTKTCPTDPPTVTKHPFQGQWLLHILHEPNIFDGTTAVYKGKTEHDQGKLMDFMNLLPPGTQLPQKALDALAQTSAASGSRLYTWEWKLKPVPGTIPASPPPP